MCGIWGLLPRNNFSFQKTTALIEQLYHFSEARGKEASGIAIYDGNMTTVGRAAVPADIFIHTEEYTSILNTIKTIKQTGIACIGHSRLATNGSASDNGNNQPITTKSVTTVHNGIIVNVDELWHQNESLNREHIVDTEIFVKLFEKYLVEAGTVESAIDGVYSKISGMASTISIIRGETSSFCVAATNNGSLYYCVGYDGSVVLASEKEILKKAVRGSNVNDFDLNQIFHLKANEAIIIVIDSGEIVNGTFTKWKNREDKIVLRKEELEEIEHKESGVPRMLYQPYYIEKSDWKSYEIDTDRIKNVRRCKKCLLPETMPFIEFDDDGVCNYCRTYKKQKYLGKKQLEKDVSNLKPNEYGQDSLVTFSGGRDSSYGLHYFVKELGLKPVAYTYDWGMVTDLARRNQSRMCADLGVEFIVVSADIRKKRDNIRKNVLAWLKKPDLGMIPIFMAGDKQYFYYANEIGKELQMDAILLASNPFEKTYFKSGYCGVKPEILAKGEEKRAMERLPLGSLMKMSGHYLGQFISNPRYINSSMIDTVKATASYYIIPHNYVHLYDYIPWNEKEIDDVLIGQYNWETADDTKSTWRIGDGTSAFYNYIYYMVTGFTENDTLRSNQIREGQITREEGIRLIYEDNKPRYDSIKWYFDTIDVPMKEALDVIKNIPKLY